MKALGVAVAAALAFAPFSAAITAPDAVQAAPCAGAGSTPGACQSCLYMVAQYHIHTQNMCYEAPAPRPVQAPPSTVQVPELPPLPPVPVEHTPLVVPPGPPSPPPTPTINPQAPGSPSVTPLVAPPKGMDAPSQAVAAAKSAPAKRINPANPPQPPMQVDDFNHQVQNVVNNHGANVDMVKVGNQDLVRPRHWDYVDYDDFHRPALYNPLTQAMTFRYSYGGAYHEAFVPAGGRIVLDVASVGPFPFTAVGDSYLASGSFYGATPPPGGWDNPPPPDYSPPARPQIYEDVSVYIPAANDTVEVGQVQVINHDAGQPTGNQDTFLLDDSTLAWGQINDSSSNAQIKVTKTQPMPGFGPTDNGSFLVALAGHQDSGPAAQPWWPMLLRFGIFAAVVGLIFWTMNRRKRSTEPTETP